MQLFNAMSVYEESSKGDFPGFSEATTRLHFQWFGTEPEVHVVLNHDRRDFRSTRRHQALEQMNGGGIKERHQALASSKRRLPPACVHLHATLRAGEGGSGDHSVNREEKRAKRGKGKNAIAIKL